MTLMPIHHLLQREQNNTQRMLYRWTRRACPENLQGSNIHKASVRSLALLCYPLDCIKGMYHLGNRKDK